ncbi:MAG: hypothetical protein LBM71_01770 [Elusimicrobiota bacterium]|jgi:hypothetical protein|nr:hypothetical protein [Elusimicrobiota bacterium]
MKARLALIITVSTILCACAGPSLRYKNDVNSLLEKGNFAGAAQKIQEEESDEYGSNNALLFQLDLSSAYVGEHNDSEVNATLAQAQDTIDKLYAKSITQGLGTLLINDNTEPYRARVYEAALTYFLRAMSYLAQNNLEDAAVEARRAVFFLDKTRQSKTSGYSDDAFVQYFASMIFEDIGSLSDARISRQNAQNAYEKDKSWSAAALPNFPPPQDYAQKGEAVIFHYNGKAPYKISKSISLAWNDIWFALNDVSDLDGVSKDTVNAVFAGAFGRSITISFPEMVDNSYKITSSEVLVNGLDSPPIETQLVADISQIAKQTLKEELAAAYARTVVRAVSKYILSVQAREGTKSATNNDTLGELVGMLFSTLSYITEKADTRSWFTLPSQIRMGSIFLPPGAYDIKLVFYNEEKKAIDEHLFEKVQINKGQRTYLYHRTAK